MFQIVVEDPEEEVDGTFAREPTDAYAIFTSADGESPDQGVIFELFSSGTQSARHSWLFDIESEEPRLLAFNSDGVLEDELNQAVFELANNLFTQSREVIGAAIRGITVTVACDDEHNFVVIGDGRLLAIYEFRQFGLAAGLLRRIVGRDGELL